VALSASSRSPVAESPLSVIGPSSLPANIVGPPRLGTSAAALAVTVRISTALVPPPSGVVTVRVRSALSPPKSGAVTTRDPRSVTLTTPDAPPLVPRISARSGSATVHPAGTPESVALSASSRSPAPAGAPGARRPGRVAGPPRRREPAQRDRPLFAPREYRRPAEARPLRRRA